MLDRQYLVDESGTAVEMIVPSGTNAGTYIVTYSGHGDALALWGVKTDGTVEIANSYLYDTWGRPAITSSHINSATSAAYGDLGFRFLYVGEFDVQWDDTLGLDLIYMHARHFGPAIGASCNRIRIGLRPTSTRGPPTTPSPRSTLTGPASSGAFC